MAKKKRDSDESGDEAPASESMLPAGTASGRIHTRNIIIYGPAKSRKTTTCSTLPRGRTKWVMSDSNCLPTLRALRRVPHPNDQYPVKSLDQAIELVDKCLEIVEEHGRSALGIDSMVFDSDTQFSDWHQAHIARESGQRFLGDNDKDNGWQAFNARFGYYLDAKARLSEHINVISICHTKPGAKPGKTTFAGLNLPPQMAGKAERLANWILFKTFSGVEETDIGDVPEEFREETGEGDNRRYWQNCLWLKPIEGWSASFSAENEELQKLDRVPGDLYELMKRDGLLE
jgi:hypothetical protein